MAHVVEEVVLAAGHLGEVVHGRLHVPGRVDVEGVAGLAGLEEGVGVLGGAADHRRVGRERPAADVGDQVVGDHLLQIVVVEQLDLGHLVRGAEAVEEVDEGHAALERGALRDEREVVGLLHRVGGQQAEAGLADRHHVGVVAEDGERVGGHRARRDVHDEGRQLSGDLVHVRDHEQQPLRRREGRRERSALKGAVDRAGGAALRLHLHHGGDEPPDVLLAEGRPLVRPLAHVGRRGDGVDGDDLVRAVGDRGDRLVAVHRHHQPLLGLGHASSGVRAARGWFVRGTDSTPLPGRCTQGNERTACAGASPDVDESQEPKRIRWGSAHGARRPRALPDRRSRARWGTSRGSPRRRSREAPSRRRSCPRRRAAARRAR